MYKDCNTEESARRQRQLEQCLLELMATAPYAGISVGQICELGGISRKSFYRYFDSKEGCLHALVDHAIMDVSSYCMADSAEDFSDPEFCAHIFEYWQQQTPLLDALDANDITILLIRRIIRYILTEEPDYARYMGIPQNSLTEHIVFTVSGVMSLVLTWHHSGYTKTAAQMGELLYQMIRQRKL